MVSWRGVQALRMIQVSDIFYSYLFKHIAMICVFVRTYGYNRRRHDGHPRIQYSGRPVLSQ